MNIKALRTAQATLIAEALVAAATAAMPNTPESHAANRIQFNAAGARFFVGSSRDALLAFAAKVKKCQGFGPTRARPIGRDGGTGYNIPAAGSVAAAEAKHGHRGDDGLIMLDITRKAAIVARLRAGAVGSVDGYDYNATQRAADAQEIELIQREMVRRGLLDATDHDKVNADPIDESDLIAVQDDATAPMFADETPAQVLADDLAPFVLDASQRFAVADPGALVPAARLAPDGRYSCDSCEGLTDRVQLTATPAGYYCPDCTAEPTPPAPVIEVAPPVQALTDEHGRRALPAPVEVGGRVHRYRINLVYYWAIPVNKFNRETHAEASWGVEKFVEERESGWAWHSWEEMDGEAVPVTIARKAAQLAREFNDRNKSAEVNPPVPTTEINSTPPVPVDSCESAEELSHRRQICGTQVPATAQNSSTATPERPRLRWIAAAGAWLPVLPATASPPPAPALLPPPQLAPGSGAGAHMIRMHFTNPADSPTSATPVRIRYSLQPASNGGTVPVLRYGHGTGTLTREAWQGYQAAGGTLEASSEREASILRQVLGSDARIVQASA